MTVVLKQERASGKTTQLFEDIASKRESFRKAGRIPLVVTFSEQRASQLRRQFKGTEIIGIHAYISQGIYKIWGGPVYFDDIDISMRQLLARREASVELITFNKEHENESKYDKETNKKSDHKESIEKSNYEKSSYKKGR